MAHISLYECVNMFTLCVTEYNNLKNGQDVIVSAHTYMPQTEHIVISRLNDKVFPK